jgi:hypothetical protein
MKKVLTILALLLLVVTVNAQRGRDKTLAADTLKGNNNQTLAEIQVSGSYNSLFISCKIERISTAAGGTLYLKTGKDSASVLVANQSTNPNLGAAPNDTLATTDVATQNWQVNIPNPGERAFHIFGDGDVNDTVKVTTSYTLK